MSEGVGAWKQNNHKRKNMSSELLERMSFLLF